MIDRPSIKIVNRLFLSAANVSRSVFISLFGLVVNYIILHYKSESLLGSYVYAISVVNLLFVITNWGGKDYNLKTFTKEPHRINEQFSAIVNSRLILLVLVIIVLWLLPIENEFKYFISVYLVLRSLNSVFETLITFQKKFQQFLLFDLVLNLSFIALILFDGNKTNPHIFLFELLLVETIRVLANIFFFKRSIFFKPSFREGLSTIKTSSAFFYMSLAGFACSRADLYIVGIGLDKQQMGQYFIVLNLVSLCHITFTALQNTFSANIFRYSTQSFDNFSRHSLLLGFIFSVLSSLGVHIVMHFYYQLPFSLTFLFCVFLNIFVFTLVLTEMYRCTRMGKQITALYILIVAAIVNAIVATILIKHLGQLGAFMGNTAGSVCTYFLMLYYLKKEDYTTQQTEIKKGL